MPEPNSIASDPKNLYEHYTIESTAHKYLKILIG